MSQEAFRFKRKTFLYLQCLSLFTENFQTLYKPMEVVLQVTVSRLSMCNVEFGK